MRVTAELAEARAHTRNTKPCRAEEGREVQEAPGRIPGSVKKRRVEWIPSPEEPEETVQLLNEDFLGSSAAGPETLARLRRDSSKTPFIARPQPREANLKDPL